jgi:mannose-6-phosphate isomerase-like protein (cupin superfamily)
MKSGGGMDESLLEIREHNGEGYKPLIDYGEWRVAVLNYLEDLQPDRIKTMERHTETDEVFVLLSGRGVLILGGNRSQVDMILPQRMEAGKIYDVKRNTWHTILLSREASVLLVENKDTGRHNSEYAELTTKLRRSIIETAQHEQTN